LETVIEMRDDIHKSAPVTRAWQSAIKHSIREADRKERLAKSVHYAISSDCYKELSPKFLANIMQQRDQKTLFGSAAGEIHSSRDGKEKVQVLEKEVEAHLRRREACGQDTAAAIEGAVCDAINGRLKATLVAIKGHLKKNGGRGADVPIDAAKKAIAAVQVNELAKELLSGDNKLKAKRRPHKNVDLDEDLR
jgi:hypothetical protein